MGNTLILESRELIGKPIIWSRLDYSLQKNVKRNYIAMFELENSDIKIINLKVDSITLNNFEFYDGGKYMIMRIPLENKDFMEALKYLDKSVKEEFQCKNYVSAINETTKPSSIQFLIEPSTEMMDTSGSSITFKLPDLKSLLEPGSEIRIDFEINYDEIEDKGTSTQGVYLVARFIRIIKESDKYMIKILTGDQIGNTDSKPNEYCLSLYES